MSPYIINKNCTKCGVCLAECPTGSIIEGKDRYVIDTDTCADHKLCVAVCPVEAIELRKSATHTEEEEE
jgi:NAD-dependent dihydropyrimidine dehydrogenase PreA subunit